MVVVGEEVIRIQQGNIGPLKMEHKGSLAVALLQVQVGDRVVPVKPLVMPLEANWCMPIVLAEEKKRQVFWLKISCCGLLL